MGAAWRESWFSEIHVDIIGPSESYRRGKMQVLDPKIVSR
jgi:hypothetical protein